MSMINFMLSWGLKCLSQIYKNVIQLVTKINTYQKGKIQKCCQLQN